MENQTGLIFHRKEKVQKSEKQNLSVCRRKNQKADCLYEWLLSSDSAAECQGSMAGNIGRNWF